MIEFEKLTYKYFPEWLRKVSLKPFSLNFIFGLRKTGKTTGMKLLIRQILSRNINPFSVFFFRTDILDDYRELYEILKDYWKLSNERRSKIRFVFLDEVTLLENWWRALKVFLDEYKPKNSVFIVSGSVSMFFHGKAETFAGRMGNGKIIDVMPLSFSEYFSVFGKPKLESTVKDLFKLYLKTGGYLGVLNNEIGKEDIILGIKNDIRIAEKSVETAKMILSSIIQKAPSPFSYHSVANDLGISVKTVIDYIETLSNMFVLKEVLYRGTDGRIRPRKERKIIIRDPFLLKSLAVWCNNEVRKDFLYEWVVQEHMLRKFGEIYYYRNRYEIDCIAGNLRVEVKAGKPHRRYPRDVKVVDEEELPMFLLSL